MSFEESCGLHLIVSDATAVGILLHSDYTEVKTVDSTAWNKERTPAPNVLVHIVPSFGTACETTVVADASTHGQPIGKVGLDVSNSVVTSTLGGVPWHQVFLAAVAKCNAEGGASA